MLTPLFVVLLSSSSDLPLQFTLPRPTSDRCTGVCAEQYRLPASSDDIRTAKDRALADDGSKCNVVGARRCTSKRRTVLRSTEDPMNTWRSALGDN